jgi:hypothetical protein
LAKTAISDLARMRASLALALSLYAASFAVGHRPAAAQSATATHVGHIMSGFPSAPNGAGLLVVAEADAALAVQHAQLAGRNQTDVGPMVQHARHVLHILDPAAFATGPGSGLGLGPAVGAIGQHVNLAAEGAPEAVRTQAQLVALAASAVDARAKQMIEIARTITRTSDYVRAYELVLQLQRLASQLVPGADVSGDGRIEGSQEGGLEHVRAHMELLSAAAEE